jgi:hypothetical protein
VHIRSFIFIPLVVCLCFSQILKAQNHNAKTLLGEDAFEGSTNIGFFVAPGYGATQMDGSSASLFTLRGGLIVHDKVSVGGFYNKSLNQIKPQSETVPDVYMDYWATGGFAEYTLLAKKVFHVTFPLFVGVGEVEMDNETGDAGMGEANFFQIEPSAKLVINLHKYDRLFIGTGYRIVGSMTYRNFNQSDISGLTAYIGLKFGIFE